jgi:hypothetical protein
MLQDLIQLFPNCSPVRLQIRAPGKLGGRKKFLVADKRIPAHQNLDLFEQVAAALDDEFLGFRVHLRPPSLASKTPILSPEYDAAT